MCGMGPRGYSGWLLGWSVAVVFYCVLISFILIDIPDWMDLNSSFFCVGK